MVVDCGSERVRANAVVVFGSRPARMFLRFVDEGEGSMVVGDLFSCDRGFIMLLRREGGRRSSVVVAAAPVIVSSTNPLSSRCHGRSCRLDDDSVERLLSTDGNRAVTEDEYINNNGMERLGRRDIMRKQNPMVMVRRV